MGHVIVRNSLIEFVLFFLFWDLDECGTNGHSCHQNGVCTNTYGGYSCQCDSGYSGDGRTCSGTLSTITDRITNVDNTGSQMGSSIYMLFKNNSMGIRVSVVRCTVNQFFPKGCFTWARFSTHILFWQSCMTRWPLKYFIADINECSSGHTCDSSASCQNTDGSYICTCDRGYTGDGHTCRGKASFSLSFFLIITKVDVWFSIFWQYSSIMLLFSLPSKQLTLNHN